MTKLDDPFRPLLPHSSSFAGLYTLKEQSKCLVYVGKNSYVSIRDNYGRVEVSLFIDGQSTDVMTAMVVDYDKI